MSADASPHVARRLVPLLIFGGLALAAAPAGAGGTPDPGTSPLAEDDQLGADGDSLPDNENQLLGFVGADRAFGSGD